MDPVMSQNPDRAPIAQPAYPQPSAAGGDYPLRSICDLWLKKIKKGHEFKQKQFGEDAATCMKFFNGPYDFMYQRMYSGDGGAGTGFTRADEAEAQMRIPAPTFRMTLNKVAEGVQLFGPVLYHKNPYRQVNPRELPPLPFGLFSQMMGPQVPGMMPGAPPPPPGAPPGMAPPMMMNPLQMQDMMFQQQLQQAQQMDKARAGLMEWMLNYTPQEYDLKEEMRWAVDEALIKGASTLWPEVFIAPGTGQKTIRSKWVTIDDIVFDPDFERRDDCKWMARRRTMPVWEAEQRFGLPPKTLTGQMESYDQQAAVAVDPDGNIKRKQGYTNDLFTFWEIYSKMGVGGKLRDCPDNIRGILDQMGENTYLCVADNTHFILNLPNELLNQPAVPAGPDGSPGTQEQILQKLDWPTPFWLGSAWPCEVLTFHEVPRHLYPMSHFKPALGELMFLNWAYSCMAGKIQVTCRDFLALARALGDDVINTILHGYDLSVLKIDATVLQGNKLDDLIKFIQHPQWNKDFFEVVERVEANFEKRTGLSELMYGMSSRQLRSASEAELKGDAINVRPDDMANKVEDSASRLAKLEAIATRWHITAQDVQPLMGPAHAFYWGQLVQQADPFAMFHNLQYTIEAGSTRKPNRERDSANMRDVMQTVMPLAFQEAERRAGMFDPNAFQQVNNMLGDWAKTMGKDPASIMFPPPPAPPPMPAPGAGAPPPVPVGA